MKKLVLALIALAVPSFCDVIHHVDETFESYYNTETQEKCIINTFPEIRQVFLFTQGMTWEQNSAGRNITIMPRFHG